MGEGCPPHREEAGLEEDKGVADGGGMRAGLPGLGEGGEGRGRVYRVRYGRRDAQLEEDHLEREIGSRGGG